MIKCSGCNRNLTGETQKGHNYYRCHSQSCEGVCVREDRILDAILSELARLPEIDDFNFAYDQMRLAHNLHHTDQIEAERASCDMMRGNLQTRKRKLVDAFVDGLIEQAIYEERITALNADELTLREREADLAKNVTD
jgi:site-specific DNA recombinase